MKKIISLVLALIMICCTIPFTAFAAEDTDIEPLRKELEMLAYKAYGCINYVGDVMPHAHSSYERLQNGLDFAIDVLYDEESTVEKYNEAIDLLTYAFNNPTLETYYVKYNYVLSTFEHNENGFYYEDDWNDFSEKRDALRDSFKTNDEEAISKAFFALHKSFVNMTSKYTLTGDVNNDGKVNIDDATLVQKYLAGQENLTELQKELVMSYDNYIYDGLDIPKPNIDCVTGLQKCVAGLTKQHTLPFSYGVNYTDSFGVTYNTKLVLYTHIWPGAEEYDYVEYVTTKTAELEAEGII